MHIKIYFGQVGLIFAYKSPYYGTQIIRVIAHT